jgi:putative ABC transport system permease protein
MDTLLKDVRYGLTGLWKHPGFTIIVVAVLALAIGANTVIFSIVDGVLMRPLPYSDSDRLVMIWGGFQKLSIERLAAKAAEYEDYRAQTQLFEQVAAFDTQTFNVAGADQSESITGARVTPNLLGTLGGKVQQGREFGADENQNGRSSVVILSHEFWQRRFGGDRNAVGQSVTLNDQKYLVIGVMPAGFQFPHASLPFAKPAALWVPLVYPAETVTQRAGPYHLDVIARLKPGVTLLQAQSEMTALGQRFENQYRGYRGPNGEDGGWRIAVKPLRDEVVGNSRRPLLLLLGAVILVLLIACANVANLLLVRAAVRQKEFAIRLALGASRWRIVRQLLLESLLLAVLGGTLGLFLASWGIRLLKGLQPANLPRVDISLDSRVLVFMLLLTVLTSLVFGFVPAWRASQFDLQRTLKENRPTSIGSWRNNSWRNALLVSEVALSLVLLIAAGLLIKSFLRLQEIKPVIAIAQLLTVEINLPDSRYHEPEQVAAFFQELLGRIKSLPGVRGATFGTSRPLSGVAVNDPFAIEGRALDPRNITFAGWQIVGAEYFHTLGIPIVEGRDLTLHDMDKAALPVAVISETMAHRYWPDENPIGKRITLGLPRRDNPWVTIIGIAKDVPRRLDSLAGPDWYLSRPYAPQRNQILFVAADGNPAELAAQVRSVVAEIDPSQTIANFRTMNDVVADTIAPRKFNMSLLALFAGIALTLASLGIYGVMAYSVAQRTHEVGVRMALGAQKSDVLRLVIKNGMTLTLIGIGLGLVIAFWLTRLMTTLLFEVTATDATTFIAVPAFFILVALLGCYIPARRAAKVDPLVALRYE